MSSRRYFQSSLVFTRSGRVYLFSFDWKRNWIWLKLLTKLRNVYVILLISYALYTSNFFTGIYYYIWRFVFRYDSIVLSFTTIYTRNCIREILFFIFSVYFAVGSRKMFCCICRNRLYMNIYFYMYNCYTDYLKTTNIFYNFRKLLLYSWILSYHYSLDTTMDNGRVELIQLWCFFRRSYVGTCISCISSIFIWTVKHSNRYIWWFCTEYYGTLLCFHIFSFNVFECFWYWSRRKYVFQ